MYRQCFFLAGLFFLSGITILHAQVSARRFDTSMKVGKAGYRVNTTNKSPDKNMLTISPIGFDKDVREFSFEIKGRIAKAEVDDINRDGYPDLVLYIYSNDSIPKGSVIGICSEKNESVAPVMFPDIYDDPKLRIGYKGKDEFYLMEGYLVRRFPVYPDSAQTAPRAGMLMRQIQYQVIPDERRGYRFKPMRSYEFTKQ
jgi:hypothetical protein